MTVTDAINRVTEAKFELGQLVATPGVIELFERKELAYNTYLIRHVSGDWGSMGDKDKQANDEALKYGERLMSAYEIGSDKIWIITERDRSATTLLLPSEY